MPSFVALFLAILESCLGCSGAYAAAVAAALGSAGESLASEGPNGSGEADGQWAKPESWALFDSLFLDTVNIQLAVLHVLLPLQCHKYVFAFTRINTET